MSTSPSPVPGAPSWPYCAHGADPATDPVGCRGVHVPGHTACLAHLADADRDAYLAGLTPGADIDHRGTPFTEPLLSALLNALRDPATGHPSLGVAQFESATFHGLAGFESATFHGNARFRGAQFQGSASFRSANFKLGAGFRFATFNRSAWFVEATFQRVAGFRSAIFRDVAGFRSAVFQGNARFESATFKGKAWFESATFADAKFASAVFEGSASFMRAVFKDGAWFESATFKRGAEFGWANFKGDAWFESVTFLDFATFAAAVFEGDAWFRSATFTDGAWFKSTVFQGAARFGSAVFQGDAWFEWATFQGDAWFESTTFQGHARFESTTFTGHARFESTTFQGAAGFESTTFQGDARFEQAVFERWVSLGPFVCTGQVRLSGAVFNGPTTLSIAAHRLECRRTRWLSTAELRLRYATVDFAHAVFEYPLTIAAEAGPFVLPDGRTVAEQALAYAPDATVRIATLRGVDAAHLVLADVDLSACLFTGTVHLDQLRLEGTCTFDEVPPGRRWRPARFTQRHTLAEEHHWRAKQPNAVQGWNPAVLGAGQTGPAQLAPVYRALRKAFEDGKNEPGAADFYYGEMEMRRHDRTGTPRAERGLLHAYWMLSGYGLRALRALGWLAGAMLITIVLLTGLGLPKEDPKQEATGTVPRGGGKVTFEIEKDDPENPTGNRWTGKRFEKALNITLNSVVFRSSGQDLTTAGTYIEMTSRLVEPALLALAVLAVRGRIKR
ncbi:pentapeptide repeat-containing protein [Streptomyces coeruleorubidus]|uniref:pentapeptide repeat-containing protein n=1 Tax=Streptomyces coeruleorubidus TaxID=116188 RepID=UPI0033D40203